MLLDKVQFRKGFKGKWLTMRSETDKLSIEIDLYGCNKALDFDASVSVKKGEKLLLDYVGTLTEVYDKLEEVLEREKTTA